MMPEFNGIRYYLYLGILIRRFLAEVVIHRRSHTSSIISSEVLGVTSRDIFVDNKIHTKRPE